MSKMGRPTDEPKTLSTRIRLSENDINQLNFCAQQLGITKAEVIRLGIKTIFQTLEKAE